MNGKYLYEHIKKFNPDILGIFIIEYVEKLKADNKALKNKLKKRL